MATREADKSGGGEGGAPVAVMKREPLGEKEVPDRDDLWSVVFFFLGSIFYLIVSIMNLFQPGVSPISPTEESLVSTGVKNWDTASWVGILGPIFYLFNGLNDIRVHRRGTMSHILYAVLFGLAATFDLVAASIYRTATVVAAYVFASLAVHSYLVSAVFLLRIKHYSGLRFKRVAQLGDILFTTGSLMDVMVSYFVSPGRKQDPNWEAIELCYFFSSSLWFMNAILVIITYVTEGSWRLKRKSSDLGKDAENTTTVSTMV
jgi:hypothetical protein